MIQYFRDIPNVFYDLTLDSEDFDIRSVLVFLSGASKGDTSWDRANFQELAERELFLEILLFMISSDYDA